MVFAEFQANLQHHLDTLGERHWVVGFSGGLDSTVLLHLLCRYTKANPQKTFSCVHVNHGLSANAHIWQTHCVDVCGKLLVPIEVLSVNLDSKGNLEQQAREARYSAIEEHIDGAGTLFLGHHQNDQVETFMLRLKRGAGPTGLSGMTQLSEIRNVYRFRPLLNIQRSALEDYAREHKLQWIEDESNQDDQFDRNFLRNQIIPKLEDRWPQFLGQVARSANFCREQQQLIDEVAHTYLANVLDENRRVNLKLLGSYSQAWQKQILRLWLANYPLRMPSEKVLEEILAQSLNGKIDATPSIHHDGLCISRFQDKLVIYSPRQDFSGYSLTFNVLEGVNLPSNLGRWELVESKKLDMGFHCSSSDVVTVSFGQFGRRFKPHDSHVTKPIKQWFKLWQIPPWERSCIPIFSLNDQVVQVGDKVQGSAEVRSQSLLGQFRINKL